MQFEELSDESPSEKEALQKHSPYDYLKDILLPAIPAVGMLLSLRAMTRFLVFAGLTLLFVVIAAYPRIRDRRRRKEEQSQDEIIAVREFPKFIQLVQRFGDLIDTHTSNTLQSIVAGDLSQNVRNGLLLSMGPHFNIWHGFWHFFMQRLTHERPTTANLTLALPEFHHLVSQYHNHCIDPIFTRMDKDMRSALTPEDRSKLNGFQQRFAGFVSDYESFTKTLSQSRPVFQRKAYHLSHSNPL
jgi:hypothetical protein